MMSPGCPRERQDENAGPDHSEVAVDHVEGRECRSRIGTSLRPRGPLPGLSGRPCAPTCPSMRDDDVLLAVKELARLRDSTAGEVLSELARTALRGSAPPSSSDTRNGVPLLEETPDAGIVTSEAVRALLVRTRPIRAGARRSLMLRTAFDASPSRRSTASGRTGFRSSIKGSSTPLGWWATGS